MKQPARPMTVGSPLPPNAADVAAGLVVEWRPNPFIDDEEVAHVDGLGVLKVAPSGHWSAGRLAGVKSINSPHGIAEDMAGAKRAAVLALAKHIAKGFDVVGSAAGAEAVEGECKPDRWGVCDHCDALVDAAIKRHAPAATERTPIAPKPAEAAYHALCVGCGAKDLHPHRPGCRLLPAEAPVFAWERVSSGGAWAALNGKEVMGVVAVTELGGTQFEPYVNLSGLRGQTILRPQLTLDEAKRAAEAAWIAAQK